MDARKLATTKPLKCRVGRHAWVKKFDHERQLAIKECAACGKRVSSGWPGMTTGGPAG
jgi:hypothetical protein